MGLVKKSVIIVLLGVGFYFLRQYLNGPMCESEARLDGKVVIVTGANSGKIQGRVMEFWSICPWITGKKKEVSVTPPLLLYSFYLHQYAISISIILCPSDELSRAKFFVDKQ